MGIIGNGGMSYLFGTHINDDPQFILSAAAYELIGAHAASDAFKKAMSLFVGGVPPGRAMERNKAYNSIPDDKQNAVDSEFFETGDEIVRCLANFIRQNRSSIDEFLQRAVQAADEQ
jgi:hypothetical protein